MRGSEANSLLVCALLGVSIYFLHLLRHTPQGATGAAASGPSPEEVAKSQITALISKVWILFLFQGSVQPSSWCPFSSEPHHQLTRMWCTCQCQVKNESEAAVVAMEGAVEAQLYDRGADLIARIFLEERAVVQVLPVRPWQVLQDISSETCTQCCEPCSEFIMIGASTIYGKETCS